MAKNFRTDKFYWGATAKKLKFLPMKNAGFVEYFQFLKFLLKVWRKGVKIIFVARVSRNLASARSSKLDLTSPHYAHYKKGKFWQRVENWVPRISEGLDFRAKILSFFFNKCHVYFKIVSVSKIFETLFFYVSIKLEF